MKYRYLFIFILGFCLSFILSTDLFDESSRVLNTLYRVCFGLFFLFVIWLVNLKEKNVDESG
ncbi:hypothetical protein [Psychrobacillus sp.]|uniref:hypothetical protein n=1 Tax=Psychrobacillus sp. TaxID=1871623 RepID=UPI0028BEBBDB|nr:hypothetical protein [Psychrobacillus sp.]